MQGWNAVRKVGLGLFMAGRLAVVLAVAAGLIAARRARERG